MITKEIVSLEKKLPQYLPGFALKSRLMFMLPVRPILRGIIFDTSSFDKISFSVTVFMLPLCVPTSHLYLNFGSRIRNPGGRDRWNIAKIDVVAELGTALSLQAIPFLSSVTSLHDFIETAKTFSQTNPNTLRAIAYSLVHAGRISEGFKILDQLLDQLDATVPWQFDLANEATRLRIQLTADPTEALRQLQAWERETEMNLGLSEANGSNLSKE